jgi:hypothetical protein
MFLRWKRQTVERVQGMPGGDGFDRGCQHGVVTTRVTPQVLESYRTDGKPKHRVVWTGPSFRMCCVDLPTRRIPWWRDVTGSLQAKCGSAVATPAWAAILDKIAEQIPRPTAAEDRIYDEGLMGHTFPVFIGAELCGPWDAFERQAWAQAIANCRH